MSRIIAITALYVGLVLGCFCSDATAFFSSHIDTVKDLKVEHGNATFGELIDKFSWLTNVKWSEHKENGVVVVTLKASLNLQKYIDRGSARKIVESALFFSPRDPSKYTSEYYNEKEFSKNKLDIIYKFKSKNDIWTHDLKMLVNGKESYADPMNLFGMMLIDLTNGYPPKLLENFVESYAQNTLKPMIIQDLLNKKIVNYKERFIAPLSGDQWGHLYSQEVTENGRYIIKKATRTDIATYPQSTLSFEEITMEKAVINVEWVKAIVENGVLSGVKRNERHVLRASSSLPVSPEVGYRNSYVSLYINLADEPYIILDTPEDPPQAWNKRYSFKKQLGDDALAGWNEILRKLDLARKDKEIEDEKIKEQKRQEHLAKKARQAQAEREAAERLVREQERQHQLALKREEEAQLEAVIARYNEKLPLTYYGYIERRNPSYFFMYEIKELTKNKLELVFHRYIHPDYVHTPGDEGNPMMTVPNIGKFGEKKTLTILSIGYHKDNRNVLHLNTNDGSFVIGVDGMNIEHSEYRVDLYGIDAIKKSPEVLQKLVKYNFPLLQPSAPNSAASKAQCPEKVLRSDTTSGLYLGWFEAEEGIHSIGIRVDGEDVHIGSSEEEAMKVFGPSEGKNIYANYVVEQFYLDYDNGEGECVQFTKLKGGGILDSQASAALKYKATVDSLMNDKHAVLFKACTGNGDTVAQKCWEKGDVNRTLSLSNEEIKILINDGKGNTVADLDQPSSFTWKKEDATHIGIENENGYFSYELQTLQGHVYLTHGTDSVFILQK